MNNRGNRSAMLIMAGTVGGQLFSIASMPVLSRLYTPAEMGYFTTFSAVTGLFATTVALHYELAIPLPKSDSQAAAITVLATIAVISSTALMTAFIACAGSQPWLLAGIAELIPVRYLLPCSLLLSGLLAIATFTAVRQQRHSANAAARLGQGGVQALVQVGSATLGSDWRALIVGQLAGLAAGILLALRGSSTHALCTSINKLSPMRLRALVHKYRDLPLAATPSSLINAASLNVPPLLITFFFGAGAAGFYGLGLRVLQTPMRFVGQAIGQVFFSQAVTAAGESRLAAVTENMCLVLFRFAVHTFIPLAVIAPAVFALAFGDEWDEAGNYTRWLTPWLMVGFVATPLSILVTVLRQQRTELLLQIAYFTLICTALAVGWMYNSAIAAMAALGVVGAVFLALKIVWILHIADCSLWKILRAIGFESTLALMLHAWLLLPLASSWSNTAIAATGCTWIALMHLVNYRVRGAYAF